MTNSSSQELLNLQGIPELRDAFVVIVKTEWNRSIVDALETECINVLRGQNIEYRTVTVPGAVEIPFAVKSYWDVHAGFGKRSPQAFITLGCVIQGGTPHFEYVCASVNNGVGQLNLMLPVPTIFGVLTVHSEAQAWERCGGIHGHKGAESAVAAIKMMALSHQY